MIEGAEIIVLVVCTLAAFLALRPYVPVWAWYALYIGAALYGLLGILEDGLDAKRAAFVGIFVLAAAHTWWRDLRGRSVRRAPGDAP